MIGREPTETTIRPRFSVDTAEALLDAAAGGLGIARLRSYQAAGAIREGRLVSLLANHAPPPVPVHLVHTGPRLLPLKLRAFLDFGAPRLQAALEYDRLVPGAALFGDASA